MNNDEFYEYEDRAYINPTLSSGEQEKFITNLRDLQGQNNAQIAEQTYNLGTAVPSNLGGLGGGEAYFTSRYQTPQVNEMVATLKTAAQAQALSDIMSNYQSQLQNRYKQAYRRAQKRARAAAAAGTNPTTSGKKGDVETVVGDTPTNYEGLAFRKWQKDNGLDTFVNPQTYVNSGVPMNVILEAEQARQANAAKREQQQQAVSNTAANILRNNPLLAAGVALAASKVKK